MATSKNVSCGVHYHHLTSFLYYLMRYFVLVTSFGLCIICILYGIGSVVTLDVTNFFCESKSLSEVRQYNYDNNRAWGGNSFDCWIIDRPTLNWQSVFSLNVNVYQASIKIDALTFAHIVQAFVYFFIALVLSIFSLYYSCLLIYDTFYMLVSCLPITCQNFFTHNNTHDNSDNNTYAANPRINAILARYNSQDEMQDMENTDTQKKTTKQKICILVLIKDGYQQYRLLKMKYIDPYYYIDSKLRILLMMIREMIEIVIQIYALFLYGGVNLLDINSKNTLGQESHIVLNFSIVIGLNCIFAGLLWIGYICFHVYLNGNIFISLTFVFDTMFEMIYVLFPLIYLTDNNNIFDLRSLGLLKQQNGFIFLQSLFAIIVLTKKCFDLSNRFDPKYITKHYWKLKTNANSPQTKKHPWILIKSGSKTNDIPRTSYELQSKGTSVNQESRRIRRASSLLFDSVIATKDTSSQNLVGLTPTPQTNIRAISTSNSIGANSVNDDKEDVHVSDERNQQQKKTEIEMETDKDTTRETKTNDETTHKESKQKPQSTPEGLHTTVNSISVNDMAADDNMNIISKSQCPEKTLVVFVGVLFIAIGITVIVSFMSFINNDFDKKCINIDNIKSYTIFNYTKNEWLSKHPELLYYQDSCWKKSIRIFDEYPCNCRLFHYYDYNYAQNQLTMNPQILESTLKQFTNLEGLYLESTYDISIAHYYYSNLNNTFKFTKEMFSNLNHLQVFATISLQISYIDEAISNLKSLQIFFIMQNEQEFEMPFDSLFKLTNLKSIRLDNVRKMTNTRLPDSICDLKELRVFDMIFTYTMEYIPFECMSKNLKKLYKFDITVFPLITYVDPQIWTLDSLNTVLLEFLNLNQSSFQLDTFPETFSKDLKKVSLYGNSDICGQNGISTIIIDNKTYNGFDYLISSYNYNNYSDGDNYFNSSELAESSLLQFIVKFNPCFSPCDTIEDNYFCTAENWQDGICQDRCNNDICNYDGGDCNQLCECDIEFLLNDECDPECNTSSCSYDMYNCLNEQFDINETCYIGNISDINSYCYSSWSVDSWCDKNCNNPECGYDNGECDSCILSWTNSVHYCQHIYTYFTFAAEFDEPFDIITMNEICDNYDLLLGVMDHIRDLNCSQAFNQYDRNKNGLIGFHEMIAAVDASLGIDIAYHSDLKFEQIDCSMCMPNASLYYV